MNADGSISADMRRKFKQVNHLVELFRPTLEDLLRTREALRIADVNCGNSYLGILLAHFVREKLQKNVELLGFDRNSQAIERSADRAVAAEIEGASFSVLDMEKESLPGGIDLLISLHGCDVATDAALRRGVEAQVPQIHVVPCCQAEIRPMIDPTGLFASFLEHGIVAVDFAANLSDVLRALWLRTRGYRSEIIEFVPMEHSPKNRLIRAKHTRRQDEAAARDLETLCRGLIRVPFLLRE